MRFLQPKTAQNKDKFHNKGQIRHFLSKLSIGVVRIYAGSKRIEVSTWSPESHTLSHLLNVIVNDVMRPRWVWQPGQSLSHCIFYIYRILGARIGKVVDPEPAEAATDGPMREGNRFLILAMTELQWQTRSG